MKNTTHTSDKTDFHKYLHRQIPYLSFFTAVPGLGYVVLAWFYNFEKVTLVWYALIVLFSLWGVKIYRQYDPEKMSHNRICSWYKEMSFYFYGSFALWVLIFIIYTSQDNIVLHYTVILSEIAAAFGASIFLVSDRKLSFPAIVTVMMPLMVYFFLVGTWYGYVFSSFMLLVTGLLLIGTNGNYNLLMQTSYQATHDILTGLKNRQFFIEYLNQFMNSLKESGKYSFLILIDLDHFKTINDTLGHETGDKLLQEVSARIEKASLDGLVVARLGGDEFIISGSEFSSEDNCRLSALAYAGDLVQILKETYYIDRHSLFISCSIGISMIHPQSSNASVFIKEADIAMYEVKAKGRDGIFLFNEDMSERVERYLEFERLLYFALKKNEISLNFQPLYDKTGKITGVETLARWNNEKYGNISPVEFISIAEKTGMILEIGKYILESAFATLADWGRQGIELQQFSINISKRQFYSYNFKEEIIEAMDKYKLSPSQRAMIVLEVTESIVAEDVERIIQIMKDLKKHSIRFSMDDFGTGYSSLGYLNRLPIDEIKIDKSFVSELVHDGKNREMLDIILQMASVFKLSTVAEGVENLEQLDYLKLKNCDIYQGFYLSYPLIKEDFEKLYFSNESNPSSVNK